MWIKYRTIWAVPGSAHQFRQSDWIDLSVAPNSSDNEVEQQVSNTIETSNFHICPGYIGYEWERITGEYEILLYKIRDLESQIQIQQQNLGKLYKKLNEYK